MDSHAKTSLPLLIILTLSLVLFGTTIQFATGGTVVNFTVSLTLSNNVPQIVWVESGVAATPTDGSTTTFVIQFNASDSDGHSNLDDSSATARLNLSGIIYNATSCTDVGNDGANKAMYNCSFTLNYWDEAAEWTINATIADFSATAVYNLSTIFTYNTLSAIQLGENSISFGTVELGDLNVNATNPQVVNNTGNVDFATLNLTAYDLNGTTTGSYLILAGNFSVNTTESEAGQGNQMINATAVTITGFSLSNGANSVENLYLRADIPSGGITAQGYQSIADWMIEVFS